MKASQALAFVDECRNSVPADRYALAARLLDMVLEFQKSVLTECHESTIRTVERVFGEKKGGEASGQANGENHD